MQHYRHIFLLLVLGAACSAYGTEVTIQHRGMILSAELDLAVDKHITDGVMLIAHGGLAHRDMEFIVHLRELLMEQGYSTLSVNFSLGVSRRVGMYDCNITHRHRHEDAVDEIGLWVAWLIKQGAPHVTLLGHSRGGGQVALYAAERDDSQIKAVILMAPQTRQNGGEGYQQRYGVPLDPVIRKARRLISGGDPGYVLSGVNMLFCRNARATAESFVSYYGGQPWLDTPTLIPHIRVPVLVVIAGSDEVVVNLRGRILRYEGSRNFRITEIENADHLFRDLYSDDAVDSIDDFLHSLP